MGVDDSQSLKQTLLELCDRIEALDIETGRTLFLRKDLPRGDISTSDLRKLLHGDMTPQEMVDFRRFVHDKAKALTDQIMAKQRK